MASNRIARINEEIQRQISADIRRLKDPRVSGSGMVSVTRVDTTGDLRYAKIYVSVLDKSQEKDVLKGLKSAGGFLRRELGSAWGSATPRSSSSRPTTPSPMAPTSWRSCTTWRRPTPSAASTIPRAPGKRRSEPCVRWKPPATSGGWRTS